MTDLTQEDQNNTVTALEYIENQEKLEKDASSILPGKFEKCTFPLGYIRQPLYACKTCSKEEPAGMCYSCSIACHASHELFELFPKRKFRCDCGLSEHPCSLMTNEKKMAGINKQNRYNHNFQGRYCRCDQHYDPETEEGTMYQCVSCEDWFHDICIGKIPETVQDFDGYICRECTKKYPFLINGNDSRFTLGLSKGNEPVTSWILPPSQMIDIETDVTPEEAQIGEKRKPENSTLPNRFKKQKSDSNCQNADISLLPEHDNIELFLQENWRDGLCKCTECSLDYKKHKVEYLLKEEETYEPEEDEDAGKSLLEVGMEKLQHLDRVKAIESLLAYKSLASDLKTFLATFKESNKVVTKEDIDQFFAEKRQAK